MFAPNSVPTAAPNSVPNPVPMFAPNSVPTAAPNSVPTDHLDDRSNDAKLLTQARRKRRSLRQKPQQGGLS